MKKLFVAVLAIAGVVACSNEETVRVQDPAQIAFDGSFVETRADKAEDPSTTTADIAAFSVWGFMDEVTGKVFVEENVTKSNGEWGYTNVQYWAPGHKYYFAALSNYTGVTNVETMTDDANGYGLGLIEYDLAKNKGGEDLLYSAVGPIAAPAADATTVEPVKFTFNHMLSKVKFSFTNGFTNELATIDVKNIRMVVPAKGSINVAQQDWWSTNEWELGTETVELAFGNACAKTAIGVKQESAKERIVFPADNTQTYAIAFDVALYQGDVVAYEGTKNGIVEGVALEIGKAYNFKVELNAKNIMDDGSELLPIVFDVEEVKTWENGGETDVALVTTVSTPKELKAAIANGGEIRLTQDINLDEIATTRATFGLFIEKDCEIDGAGFTLTSNSGRAIAVSGAENVVLKNFTLKATGERGIQVQQGAKNVTIENVTATAANYTVSLPTSAGAAVVTINNCDLKGLNTVNVAAPGAKITINDTTLRCEDNSSLESYAVINMNMDAVGAEVIVNGGEVIITGSNVEGTTAGNNGSDGGTIVFNGTKGNPTVIGDSFGVMRGDYYLSCDSFEEALKVATSDDIIKLTKSLTVETPIVVPADRDITLDLNGKTITAGTLDPIKNYGTMKVMNGKVVAGNSEGTRRCIYNYGNMIIEDVEFTQTYGKKGAAINNEGKMTINNATVNSVFYAVWSSGANTETTINGGKYTSMNNVNNKDVWAYAVVAYNGAKLTINGGEFTGNHGAVAVELGSKAFLNAGTFHCTAEYTGNSDWTLFAGDSSSIEYDAANCVLSTNNPSGAIYGNFTAK